MCAPLFSLRNAERRGRVKSSRGGIDRFLTSHSGGRVLKREARVVLKCQRRCTKLPFFFFFFCSCVSLTFNALLPSLPSLPPLWRSRRRHFCVGPALSLCEYEQTDVTAGRPYVTSLSDLYALIIPSRGTNIDILALNTQTLQSASTALGIIRLPATCGAGTRKRCSTDVPLAA